VGTLIKHGANPTFSNSLCLKRAVKFGTQTTIRIARNLIAAGALVSDLDSLYVGMMAAPWEWDFLRELLRLGIRTVGISFKPHLAVKFFTEIQPQDLLNDRDGVSFPLSVLSERDEFVKKLGVVAVQESHADKVKVTEWLRVFLVERTANKR